MMKETTSTTLESRYSSLGVLFPAPSAGGELVVRWLRRVRLGAILGLAVSAYYVVSLLLGGIGIIPGRRLLNAVSCLLVIVGAIGVWMLVTAEPQNRGWLRLHRWVLRSAAVVIVTLCGISLITFSLLGGPPESAKGDDVWQIGIGMICLSLWMLLDWYLRTLSQRLGDTTLRKNFTVLLWLSAIFLALGVLAVSCRGAGNDPRV